MRYKLLDLSIYQLVGFIIGWTLTFYAVISNFSKLYGWLFNNLYYHLMGQNNKTLHKISYWKTNVLFLMRRIEYIWIKVNWALYNIYIYSTFLHRRLIEIITRKSLVINIITQYLIKIVSNPKFIFFEDGWSNTCFLNFSIFFWFSFQ